MRFLNHAVDRVAHHGPQDSPPEDHHLHVCLPCHPLLHLWHPQVAVRGRYEVGWHGQVSRVTGQICRVSGAGAGMWDVRGRCACGRLLILHK